MMPPAAIAAAVTEIRARPSKEAKLDARPVTTPWVETPPVRMLDNADSTARGHIERFDEDGVWCDECKAYRPERGGWSMACSMGMARRDFRGG